MEGNMKKMGLTVATVGIFLLSVSGLRAGNFSGIDDFTGTTIDTAKWDDTLAPTGFGAFTQANSQLELDLDYDGGGSSYVNSHLP